MLGTFTMRSGRRQLHILNLAAKSPTWAPVYGREETAYRDLFFGADPCVDRAIGLRNSIARIGATADGDLLLSRSGTPTRPSASPPA